jgi:F0F1-type ATP synthase membrane subunit c/vacuolar-type H+-ATPase subunit K
VDPFHDRLARLGLTALASYGCALAEGYAVSALGQLDRPSEDVDLFTTMAAKQAFPEAVRPLWTPTSATGFSSTS